MGEIILDSISKALGILAEASTKTSSKDFECTPQCDCSCPDNENQCYPQCP